MAGHVDVTRGISAVRAQRMQLCQAIFASRCLSGRSLCGYPQHAEPADVAGSETVNFVPAPSRLSTDTWPPCASTMYFTMLKPRPQPPCDRERCWSTW